MITKEYDFKGVQMSMILKASRPIGESYLRTTLFRLETAITV